MTDGISNNRRQFHRLAGSIARTGDGRTVHPRLWRRRIVRRAPRTHIRHMTDETKFIAGTMATEYRSGVSAGNWRTHVRQFTAPVGAPCLTDHAHRQTNRHYRRRGDGPHGVLQLTVPLPLLRLSQ
jgi:hypothetical protein